MPEGKSKQSFMELSAPLPQPSSSSNLSQEHQRAALVNPPTSPLLVYNQLERLGYEIHGWSSYSAQYHPKNILVNKPTDQSSRWSSGSNNQMQYLMLKLDRPSIVHAITFGKYHKVHVCNLKEFKVFGGLSLNNMTELLHSGLRNDNEPETFTLKFKSTGDVVFPCNYIKIVPLMAWGANFNFSIWYVELRGISDTDLVAKAHQDYLNYRENEVVRLCLKHFRQRNMLEAFNALQTKTHIELEHPTLTHLHRSLVLEGNYVTAESIMAEAGVSGLFMDYINEAQYHPIWRRIHSTDSNGESPGMRGGHQMCMDIEGGHIYLLGGWDGTKDLSDFWVYHVHTDQWECLSTDTKLQGGPGARSCHKICFDSKCKQVYVLGRYIDPQSRVNTSCESDFYRYDTIDGRWIKAMGGPDLIYDHQMALDSDNQILYVFGGRIISATPNVPPENSYSGLYAYHINDHTWRLIRSDQNQPENSVQIKSRIGHSMLFNHRTNQLYIFAGQRQKDYLSDYYIYDIATDTVIEMSRDSSKNGGPDAGFTQRATIDVDLDEFYVFSGLMREKNSTTETVKNSLWVYNIRKDKWSKVYQNENTGESYWKEMAEVEPCPRFAHQLVYDDMNKIQYLFGGNPGEPTNMSVRLDDFWSLRLSKPRNDDIARRCKFFIRRQQFKEMCLNGDSMDALKYLQVELSQCVNHEDEQESLEFRNLTTNLFEKPSISASGTSGASSATSPSDAGSHASGSSTTGMAASVRELIFKLRTELYETLLEYFPDSMKQPKGSLVELIPA